MTRESTVFYRSFYEAVKDLPAEEFKKSVCAIMDYGLDGMEPTTNGIEKTIYLLTKPQIDANNKRYENGCKGGKLRQKKKKEDIIKEPNRDQALTENEAKDNQNVCKGKAEYVTTQTDKETDIEDNNCKKSKKFHPPTVEEVKKYCDERKNGIDPDQFVDFYSASGWTRNGGVKIKDWRACVRTWENRKKMGISDKQDTSKQVKKNLNNFDRRKYDMDALEEELLKKG